VPIRPPPPNATFAPPCQTLLPLDLRPKKTRALRRALSKEQKALVTAKEQKRANAFPARKYALKA
jgi:large subunit ribosomal protein L35e